MCCVMSDVLWDCGWVGYVMQGEMCRGKRAVLCCAVLCTDT